MIQTWQNKSDSPLPILSKYLKLLNKIELDGQLDYQVTHRN
jgi:hypothetical protein